MLSSIGYPSHSSPDCEEGLVAKRIDETPVYLEDVVQMTVAVIAKVMSLLMRSWLNQQMMS